MPNYTLAIRVYASPALRRRIKAAAKKADMSESEWMQDAALDRLAREREEKKRSNSEPKLTSEKAGT